MASTEYNHRKGSTFRAAMIRGAEKRQCPRCNRKSAVISDGLGGRVCRWDCGYYWAPWMTEAERQRWASPPVGGVS